MEAEEETADPGSAKKQPLNVHETKQLLFSILELLRAGRRCPEQNIEGKLQQGLVEARWLSKHWRELNLGKSPTDWFTELRFYTPLDTKYVVLEMLFPANLLPSTPKKIKTRRNNHQNVQ